MKPIFAGEKPPSNFWKMRRARAEAMVRAARVGMMRDPAIHSPDGVIVLSIGTRDEPESAIAAGEPTTTKH